MKTFFTSIIAIVITTSSFAQNPDKALARVRYSFSHIQDTTQKDKPYTENMLLVIGKNASVYTSYDKINRNLEMERQIQEQLKNQAGSGSMKITIGSPLAPNKQTNPLDYFFFASENKFFTKERIFNNYLVEEEAPKINWKITKDTANFSGVKCQKAIANFKGRTWTAWFAPDMPFQSGPWKLNGLPGLIIEAVDQTGTVKFQFAGIDDVKTEETKTPEKEGPKILTPGGGAMPMASIMGMDGNSYLGAEIKLPTDAIKTNKKELDKLKAARDKNPQGFMNAQMASQGIQMGVSRTAKVVTNSDVKKIVINNPIELPETK
ncbi:GLPGLI family protein [Pedobacter insulae]|uniref:GLPGLI family protein n=1 Tax=Pedobacter insulae TaxID=414048 RepID=A0A1I2UVS0_9SPHI|nr:GLPGLI family protein [Pedobacter insulae]SFG78871.1 GLPGLI family protein [Pedobacter insulae]